ncbi:DUF4411 family protein [Qipengyuania sp. 902]|uniref:DUF4411 family protein n=1 Tax=Qipengyuania sp. 902 TaxID=3417565 RepID=UPI003EBBFDFC
MLYLLDANVLITAHHLYYPVDAVPEFWDWLAHQGEAGNIKMPIETFEEVKDGSNDADRDLLYAWVQDDANKAAILFDGDVQPPLVQQVTGHYAPDLTDDELEAIGRDPFLIAHALADTHNRCVVTTEVSKPRLQRQNRRVPDVCADAGVQWCDTFAMLRVLQFSTRWRG